ncbi:MAG: DUF488 family protein [Chitinivibrionales bacterium]|nr:DUF488 family protein [Chitinivibrionales bacterium]MBD3394599.1 DUF488 family protein [Chitinivibrionales bacterium]
MGEIDETLYPRCVSSFIKRPADLIRHVYVSFPYYAINSIIAEDHLSKDELKLVDRQRPNTTGNRLCTIGYEGKTIDEYLNLLVKNGVRVLCDVRKNPLSMKYGFSKGTLKSNVEKLEMEYVHIPELGIATQKRKNLESLSDYEKLFEEYEEVTLAAAGTSLDKIRKMTEGEGRVALTCFEADPRYCHRTRVARALQQLPNFSAPLIEL